MVAGITTEEAQRALDAGEGFTIRTHGPELAVIRRGVEFLLAENAALRRERDQLVRERDLRAREDAALAEVADLVRDALGPIDLAATRLSWVEGDGHAV